MTRYPVTIRFPLHWGDMDALGHVNNARYFTWFESARIELFRRLGVTAQPPLTIGPVLATTTCDYLRPVTYPAEITVGARVTNIGRTSVAMEYEAFANDEEEPVARSTSVIVLVDYANMQKVPISDDLRMAIDKLNSRN